jgi:hypothetical protein
MCTAVNILYFCPAVLHQQVFDAGTHRSCYVTFAVDNLGVTVRDIPADCATTVSTQALETGRAT